ncbi:hypothetical protein [Haloarcula laminariae]|uniref:hypothetical protein n=1 Tax=Haloarcula laminariae TaxID=2961577 RepID=UPI0021C7516C|nr:hypothetical protein [Halomicroarcula laminariae]
MTDRPNTADESRDEPADQSQRDAAGDRTGTADQSGADAGGATVSRRTLLSSLAAVGAVAGVGYSLIDDGAVETPEQTGQNQQGTTQNTSESPFQYEREVRQSYQSESISVTPTFLSSQTSVTSDSGDQPTTEIIGWPTDTEDGDQLLFVVEDGFGESLIDSMVEFFVDVEEPTRQSQTEVGDNAVTFDVYAGDAYVIGAGSHTGTDSGDATEEVYIVRGESTETVLSLVDAYDEKYASETA